MTAETPSKNPFTEGFLRMTHFDPGLENDPSAAWIKAHNPFGRMPGLNKDQFTYVAEGFVRNQHPGLEVFVTFDAGQKKIRQFLLTELKKKLPPMLKKWI